jgi:putative ABC transport system ATP-binding protein
MMVDEQQRPLIEIRGITKTYVMGDQEVHALRGVNLDIRTGEFVAIMGASGSGKSTMMNILGCLDRPTTGQYFLGGRDVATLRDDEQAVMRNRMIGFVFQSFNLLKRTTALKNVELPLVYAGVSSSARAERARAALETVGLGARLDHMPSQLSGGQQQRVAIARALVTNPSLILADEPTGNLDSQVSGEVMRLFQNLNNQGLTVVLVTHEEDIAAYARRVVRMRDGRVLSDNRQEPHMHAVELYPTMPPPPAPAPPVPPSAAAPAPASTATLVLPAPVASPSSAEGSPP